MKTLDEVHAEACEGRCDTPGSFLTLRLVGGGVMTLPADANGHVTIPVPKEMVEGGRLTFPLSEEEKAEVEAVRKDGIAVVTGVKFDAVSRI